MRLTVSGIDATRQNCIAIGGSPGWRVCDIFWCFTGTVAISFLFLYLRTTLLPSVFHASEPIMPNGRRKIVSLINLTHGTRGLFTV